MAEATEESSWSGAGPLAMEALIMISYAN